MGAHTAMLTAARRPDLVSQLILIEGGLGGEGPDASHEVINWFRSWPAPFAYLPDAVSWFEGQGYRPDAARAWAAGLRETPGGLVPRFVPEVLLQQMLAVHLEKRLQEWTTVSCPTLLIKGCLLYTSPSPRDRQKSRMPSSA